MTVPDVYLVTPDIIYLEEVHISSLRREEEALRSQVSLETDTLAWNQVVQLVYRSSGSGAVS